MESVYEIGMHRINMQHYYNCTAKIFKGECSVFKKIILWMKTIHYPNTITSHLVTIVPMAPLLLQNQLQS